MPIYEYKCEHCGFLTEIIQKYSDPPPEKCTSCNQGPMKKMVSKASFVLKGSGWYTTDYKKPNNETLNTSTKATTQETPKKNENASEKTSKPEKGEKGG